MLQVHFHARSRCQRSPTVFAAVVYGCAEVKPSVCMHPHLPAHAVRQWHADLIDVNHQRIAVPTQLAGSDGELRVVTMAMPRAAFGHGPAFGMLAVERHV